MTQDASQDHISQQENDHNQKNSQKDSQKNSEEKGTAMVLVTMVDVDAWEAVITHAQTQPVVVFKHSATCPISAAGKREIRHLARRLESNSTDAVETAEVAAPVIYMVVVQEARALSNHIAEALDVKHETPQAIVLYKDKAVQVLNHYDIKADALLSDLAGLMS